MLDCLLLGNNKLDSWQSIDALASFGRLKELRLSGNPLISSSKEERFEVKSHKDTYSPACIVVRALLQSL